MSRPIGRAAAWILFGWLGASMVFSGFNPVFVIATIVAALWYHQKECRQIVDYVRGQVESARE